MEIILEIIVWLLIETLLPVSTDFVVEFGFGDWLDSLSKRATLGAVMTFVIYASLGLIIGCLSLLILPESFARSRSFPGISLIVAPLAAGTIMMFTDLLHQPVNEKRLQFTAFAHAFVFAFCMTLVRFLYAV